MNMLVCRISEACRHSSAYGLPLVEDGKTVIYIWPVEDPDKHDALRKSVGLMPIGEYLEIVKQQGVEMIYDKTKAVKDFK